MNEALFGIDFHQRGSFVGNLVVEYVSLNHYLYTPGDFAFVRANGQVIQPGVMDTDGASVPRLLWSIAEFSPWDVFKAAAIHDWLYIAHHQGNDSIDFATANLILAEAMYTQGQDGPDQVSDLTIWAYLAAVSTPIGQEVWDHGMSQARMMALMGTR